MREIDKNTVSVKEQIKATKPYHMYPGGEYKVLIVGNSITRHTPSEVLGWYGDYGMAASCEEKDYVHILMREYNKRKDSTYLVFGMGEWEMNYRAGSEVYDKYEVARDFDADLIIIRGIENTNGPDFDWDAFKVEYDKFVQHLNKSGRAKVIVTTGFWRHPGDSAVVEVAKERGYTLVELGDLGQQPEMKALGLFAHSGVANHPGDKGMEQIALRLLAAI